MNNQGANLIKLGKLKQTPAVRTHDPTLYWEKCRKLLMIYKQGL